MWSAETLHWLAALVRTGESGTGAIQRALDAKFRVPTQESHEFYDWLDGK